MAAMKDDAKKLPDTTKPQPQEQKLPDTTKIEERAWDPPQPPTPAPKRRRL